MATSHGLLTIGEVGNQLGCQSWRIDRLVKRKLIPKPERLGPFRVFFAKDLPAIREALVKVGYLDRSQT